MKSQLFRAVRIGFLLFLMVILAACTATSGSVSNEIATSNQAESSTMTDETLEHTIARLSDRAEISELLFNFSYKLDTKNWQGFVDLFADDGRMVLPWGLVLTKAELLEAVSGHLGQYEITHHISSNHLIEIDGDTASSSSYLQAYHDLAPSASGQEWQVLGGYECQYIREDGVWRFQKVRLKVTWERGKTIPPEKH